MLPGGTDSFYRRLLASGHKHHVRLEVWSGTGQRLDTLLPTQSLGEPEGGLAFLSGGVTATLNSRVARNLNISVPAHLYPASVTDLLAPFGNEIRAFYGVALSDSDKYVWPVFRGRIQDVELSSDGVCTVQCSDRAQDVLDVAFERPQNSVPGNSVYTEWQRLIIDAVPHVSFGDSDEFSRSVEPLTWEFDRGSALDEMARSVGALWYPLADGSFVLRAFPWAQPAQPVLTIWDGQGGIVDRWRMRRSRRGMFNTVTVSGERLNGDAPVHATARDSRTTSPTYVGGNFGVKSRLERLQTPSTPGGAQGAAEALLRTYVAPIEEWTVETVPDASLELGDVLRYNVNGRDVIQVVTGLSLPLDLSGNMIVNSRSLVIGSVE